MRPSNRLERENEIIYHLGGMEEGIFGGFGGSSGFHEKTEGDISRRQESIKRGNIGN